MIDKTSIIKTLQLENMTHSDQMEVLDSIEKTIKESKVRQKEQLQTNVDFVVQALRNIKQDLEDKFSKLDNKLVVKVDNIISGKDGLNGKDGINGRDGKQGRDGEKGPQGEKGIDGKDGIGVSKAKVDIDGELVITLTDGRIIEAGKVFTKAVAEKIRVFSNSDNRIPELVGQSGKILSNNGVNVTWIPASSGSGTVTSVATGTGLTGGPITSTGTISIDSTVATLSGAQTLTNKRIDPRVASTATATSLTPDISANDVYAYTALASGLTINAPIGTPVNGDKLIFRILDNGTTRTITWNATFTSIVGTAFTNSFATTANKTTYIGCIYNAFNTRWDVVAVTTQA